VGGGGHRVSISKLVSRTLSGFVRASYNQISLFTLYKPLSYVIIILY